MNNTGSRPGTATRTGRIRDPAGIYVYKWQHAVEEHRKLITAKFDRQKALYRVQSVREHIGSSKASDGMLTVTCSGKWERSGDLVMIKGNNIEVIRTKGFLEGGKKSAQEKHRNELFCISFRI